jgi:hypothetical protein
MRANYRQKYVLFLVIVVDIAYGSAYGEKAVKTFY